MSTFTKTYSGKITRLLSEGQFVPSDLPEVYIETEQDMTVEEHNIKGVYPSKIFNIVKLKDKVEITTNTLGILISNQKYYKKLSKLPSDFTILAKENYSIVDNTCYINTDKDYFIDGSTFILVQPVIGLQPWNKDSNVDIRKLKDRFKITIKTKQPESIRTTLIHPSIFTPTIKDTCAILADCIFKTPDNKLSYLYSHTYEYYDKEEIHTYGSSLVLRDVPITEPTSVSINDKYLKVSYKTFRSNLFINTLVLPTTYVSLDHQIGHSNLKISSESSLEDLFNITRTKTYFTKVQSNPYTDVKQYKGRPEYIYFVFDTEKKYSTYNNVPLGCERFVLDLGKLITKNKKTLQVDGIQLLSVEPRKDYKTMDSLITYTGSTRLDVLDDKLKGMFK